MSILIYICTGCWKGYRYSPSIAFVFDAITSRYLHFYTSIGHESFSWTFSQRRLYDFERYGLFKFYTKFPYLTHDFLRYAFELLRISAWKMKKKFENSWRVLSQQMEHLLGVGRSATVLKQEVEVDMPEGRYSDHQMAQCVIWMLQEQRAIAIQRTFFQYYHVSSLLRCTINLWLLLRLSNLTFLEGQFPSVNKRSGEERNQKKSHRL